MTLRGEVIQLIGLDFVDQLTESRAIGQVAVVQLHLGSGIMWIAIQMINPGRVERARATYNPVDQIALLQQELGQIRSVLSGDACDQGHRSSIPRRHAVSEFLNRHLLASSPQTFCHPEIILAGLSCGMK